MPHSSNALLGHSVMRQNPASPRCFERRPVDHPRQGSAGPDDKMSDQALAEEHSAALAAAAVHSVGSLVVLEVAAESFPESVESERSLAEEWLPAEQCRPVPGAQESPGSVSEERCSAFPELQHLAFRPMEPHNGLSRTAAELKSVHSPVSGLARKRRNEAYTVLLHRPESRLLRSCSDQEYSAGRSLRRIRLCTEERAASASSRSDETPSWADRLPELSGDHLSRRCRRR